jgi:hypothetical protein
MREWLTRNWGNLASAIGLIISIAVLVFSKRAAKAATEAKAAIEKRSAAQDLRECSDEVSLMRLLCDNQSWEVASFVCNGLIQDVTFLNNRWAAHFEGNTRAKLNLLANQLDTLNGQLRKFTSRVPTSDELESLGGALIKVTKIISAEVGRYESLI